MTDGCFTCGKSFTATVHHSPVDGFHVYSLGPSLLEGAAIVKVEREEAAMQMRDKCLDAIKSLRAVPHGAAYSNAINDAVLKVESLTLEDRRNDYE